MSKILVIAEHDGSKLNPATAKCVACASAIPGADITVLVLAASAGAVAAQAASIAGVKRVVTLESPAFTQALAAVIAPAVVSVAGDYSHVFGPSTTFGKDLMPRIAALLGAPQISDLMAVESATRFKRPIYAGNAIVTVECQADSKVVATVRTASFEAAGAASAAAPIEALQLTAELPTHTRFVSVTAARSDRPDLQTAARVVSGGRALGSADNFKILYSLADKMGAAVGASRAGRADRQDHRAGAVHGVRYLGSHPASHGYQGCAHHRGRQQGPGGTDLRGGRLWLGRRSVSDRARTRTVGRSKSLTGLHFADWIEAASTP
jgi:electron transfer flavoprotein alpha subunit